MNIALPRAECSLTDEPTVRDSIRNHRARPFLMATHARPFTTLASLLKSDEVPAYCEAMTAFVLPPYLRYRDDDAMNYAIGGADRCS